MKLVGSTFNNANSFKYNHFYEDIKITKYLYTNFELSYETLPGVKFTQKHMSIPVIIAFIYLLGIFMGKRYMDFKQPKKLNFELACWNGVLSLFSFMGTLRTVPELLYILSISDNIKSTICTDPILTWGTGATGLWVQLFVFSKIPELFDTYFIIIRKKPLIFLHWYHHVSVLLYCWHSYATKAPQTLYFVAMNYTVHTIMYGYYCLMSLGLKPGWLSAKFITLFQIFQMIIGTLIQGYSLYYHLCGSISCQTNKNNIIFGSIMYTSYLALFVSFACKRYFVKKSKLDKIN